MFNGANILEIVLDFNENVCSFYFFSSLSMVLTLALEKYHFKIFAKSAGGVA
jgi:hypothetical protein